MKKKTLCLKFKDREKEFLFEDKVFVIEDKKLIENLEKPCYKNSESELIIKSMNDMHISDVVQIKVNIFETGYFLVNFAKNALSEEKRAQLLKEISSLKSNAVQTNSTQLKKVRKLIQILNKYQPIYATFTSEGKYIVNITKLSEEELKFPVLVLEKPKKKGVFQIKNKSGNSEVSYSSFSLFESDYLFILLFSLLGSFGVFTATFEIMNKQTVAIFLGILGLAFAFVLIIAMQATIYKKGKLRNPILRYYLCVFILIGIALGITGGYFVSKYLLKTENPEFSYSRCFLFSIPISLVALLSSVSTSRLANLIIKRKYEKKD